MPDYSSEPPLSERDRQSHTQRAKARKRTIYALTVVCRSEKEQKQFFTQARRHFPGRRIRVVVS